MRYHGSKWKIAPWIIARMPNHSIYVEQFGGSGSVLARKPRARGEVYNDLDGQVVNFFRVLQDSELRERLIERIVFTPYARSEYERAQEPSLDAVECAARLLVRAGMGFASHGATAKTGMRIDTKRQGRTAQGVWAEMPEQLVAYGQRFAGVLVEERDAALCMSDHDGPDTLHFVDPPYTPGQRVDAGSDFNGYAHEMTDEGHEHLVSQLLSLHGMVMLCGYQNDLYDDRLLGWHKHTRQVAASGAAGSVLRQEVLWLSPTCADDLFSLSAA